MARRTAALAGALAALLCLVGVAHALSGSAYQADHSGIKVINVEEGLPLSARRQSAPVDDTHWPYVEQVGKRPKVYLFHSFLTDEERRHMLSIAAPEMKRSTVVGAGGASVVDNIRTSYGMFIRRLHDPIIERIQRRISIFTQIPISHQEDIQVLRYEHGQQYGAHFDSSYDKGGVGPKQRLATFYMYLSDVEEGGETAFPRDSEWADPSIPRRLEAAGVQFSDCAKGHVAAKPKAGDAVLFYSYHPNGTMDAASMHTGCPVIKGIKWGAPLWIHIDEFHPPLTRPDKPLKPRDPGMCEDDNERCATWVAAGECTKNPAFMTGEGTTSSGACRRSCGVCKPCHRGDWKCINDNRRQGGFLELDETEMKWLGVHFPHHVDPSPEL